MINGYDVIFVKQFASQTCMTYDYQYTKGVHLL